MSYTRTYGGVELTFAENMSEWRELVLERAGWKCELTGKNPRDKDNLDAHHLVGRGTAHFRLCVENGLVMMHDTHMKYHNEAGLEQAMEEYCPDRLGEWEFLKRLRNQFIRNGVKARYMQ